MPVRVGLVAESQQQLSTPAPARRLFTGPIFMAAAAYAEARYDHWYVLSELYGRVHPDTTIAPYPRGRVGQTKPWRQRWGRDVTAALAREGLDPAADVFYLHASTRYARPLEGRLARLERPVAGLVDAAQLAWYAARGS